MLEIVLLTIALLGTLIASYYDLKTTEIPDWLPIVMIIAGIAINFANYLLTKNPDYILLSFFNGIIFTLIGFSMYLAGQWGAGDAFLLIAVGFLIPKNFLIRSDFPFVFTYLTNLFFLGSIYMILYSLFYAVKNEKIIKEFLMQLRRFSFSILILFILFILASLIFYYFLFHDLNIRVPILVSSISTFLIIIFIFSKVVEKSFIRKIPVSKLKVGDVLLENKRWEGITKEEIERIKKSGRKYVYIKSGICFAPSFFIALVFTMLFGNSVFLLINLFSLI
ncbi:MAG: A24 family peptidase [Candidatus Aenigmarchaeota archaeon]|nr:A24 family peptidase [Candidatus Aenigmarchaeota archaeon]